MTTSVYSSHIYVSHGNMLTVELYDRFSLRTLFQLEILELYWSERKLDDGRFINYRNDISTYPVCVNDIVSPKLTFARIIEWITTNAHRNWNFNIRCSDDTHYDMIIYFEDECDTVLFALSIVR